MKHARKQSPENSPSRLLAWGLLLLVAAIFAVNVTQQYFIGDDAFISFRYARHLAEGHGPVWNPGERVEGYTNFSWVVLMAGALVLGLRPEIVANAVGIASGAALLAALIFVYPRPRALRDWPFALVPLALAGNRSFGAWCTGGLETMSFTLLVFGGFVGLLRERREPARVPWLSASLFALATLTRPEGALFAAVAAAWGLIDCATGRRPLRRWLLWPALYAPWVAAHLAWRLAYYGFWLPNTFHAKVSGAWWDQGLHYLGLFAADYHALWLLPLILVALVRRPDFETSMFACACAAYLAYVAYVGGDRFEFRFIVVVLPYLLLLAARGLREIARGRDASNGAPGGAGTVLAGLAGAALILAGWTGSRTPEADGVRGGVAGLATIEGYASRRAEEGRFLRELVDEGLLPPDLVLCVGGAGAVPYYTRWPTIDRRGINDVFIARLPLARRGAVAHERDAPLDYLERRGVVVFDLLNRIVHDEDARRRLPPWVEHDGARLPLVTVAVRGRLLVFAAVQPEAHIAPLFSRVGPLRRGGPDAR